MFPHERSLVEKMKDQPFALVGVNSDENFEELKKTKFVEEKITWRSFQNGPQGSGNSISEKWKLQGWPTLYLIDAQGKIRKKWIGGPDGEELDKAIEALVAEAKKSPAAKPAAQPEKPKAKKN